jgi:hypothetical protein
MSEKIEFFGNAKTNKNSFAAKLRHAKEQQN